ncbi:uncharacterized protein [Nicotiana sylvestris]|uniref:uncharacterized protein n=1 Tax=Nicotiana sylvestris TaxID=4096 RepID=UPI00388C5280
MEGRSHKGFQGGGRHSQLLRWLRIYHLGGRYWVRRLTGSKEDIIAGSQQVFLEPKVSDRFLAPSVDPNRKWSIIFSIPEDARVFSAPVGVDSYLRCLVTEKDQVVMNKVETPCLFNEAQQALDRVSVLHHETFLRYRDELTHHEAKVWELTERRDTYNLLNEKLQAELEVAQREHGEMAEQGRDIQAQVDKIQAEAEEFKKNMDILALKKKVVQAQLESAEAQLRAEKEKTLAQAKKIEELQSQLNSAISGKENLAKELKVDKSEAVVAKTEVDAKVA